MDDEKRAREEINEAGQNFIKNTLDEQERALREQLNSLNQMSPGAQEMEGWDAWESGPKQRFEAERAEIRRKAEIGLEAVKNLKNHLGLPLLEDEVD